MSSTFWFIMPLLTAMFIALSAATTNEVPMVEDMQPYGRAVKGCNIDPSVCRGRGSGGPVCCYKQCVNLKKDTENCGKCGKRCKYSEICCQGECVNPSVNERHCGRCNHKCSTGISCVYGLCSYA